MTLRLLISLSLLLLVWQKAGAQLAPADDFFNSGAQLFITNNIPAALERVETGLKMYPDDEKLKKLEQLLKQQQQSQQNQQQNQQSQSQQQQSQSQNSKGQQNQQQSQPKPGEPKQADQKKDQSQDQQKASSAKPDNGEKKDDQNRQGQPAAPGQMTPEDAKRLLDSQKGNEQVLPMKPLQKPQDSTHPVRDW